MSDTSKRTLLLNSKIAVGLVMAVLFVLGIILVAQGFMDTRNYREQIVKIVREQTGREVSIKGKVSISLLPTPTIYIPGVELRDADSDTPAPAISVDMIRLNVTFDSVFTARPQLSGITLERPVLEVARAEDGKIHWDWLNSSLLKALSASRSPGSALSIAVNNGTVIYHDNHTETSTAVNDIAIDAVATATLRAHGAFAFFGHKLAFTANTDAVPSATLPAGAMPLNVTLYRDAKNAVQLAGSLDVSGELPKIQGKVDVKVEDALEWMGPKQEEAKPALLQITRSAVHQPDQKTFLPLTLSCDWAQEGMNVALTAITLDGLSSKGSGKAALAWAGGQPDIGLDMAFSTLNYDQWQLLLAKAFSNATPAEVNPYHQEDAQAENPLPKNLHMRLALTADALTVGQQTWQKATLSANLSDAVLTANQFTIQLPGESSLALFGIISMGNTGGMRFEGSMETQGKSLRRMLTVFDASAVDLPDTGLGEFYARSNLFVSAQQMRLSEADVKISDLRLSGGLVAYYDANPRMEADVKLKDINFDYFRDAWRQKQQAAGPRDFFLQFDKSVNFDWLKKLHTTIDLKIAVDGFTFMDRKGDSAAFRLFAKEGEFGIYDIRFTYPDGFTQGGLKLDVKGEQPFIDVTLNTDRLDTDYFSLGKPEDSPGVVVTDSFLDKPVKKLTITPQAQTITLADNIPAPPVTPYPAEGVPDSAPEKKTPADANDRKIWSDKLIDMSWMEGFGGNFDISIGTLTHGKFTIDRLKTQAKLDHNLLSFQSLSFLYWQGRCSMLGSMYGGKVPGLSMSYTLYDADLHDILSSLTGRGNVSGKVSISGTLTTSGVNYKSWVEQAEGKMILTGRGVHVQGLNMHGVVDTVRVSRTAADVFNNVNLTLVNGATDFDLDGNINIKNGIMRTPGITLKSGAIIGDLTGDIKLVPWTIDLSTRFDFPELNGGAAGTTPSMPVQLAGPIDAPELRTDTSALEAYVIAIITGK